MSKTVDLDRAYAYKRKIYGPGEDVEVPNDFPEIKQDSGEEGDGSGASLEDMKVDELRALAEEREIEGASGMKKPELVEVLKGGG